MMKKFLSVSLAAVMAVAMMGCGSAASSSSAPAETPAPAEESAPAEEEAAPAEEEAAPAEEAAAEEAPAEEAPAEETAGGGMDMADLKFGFVVGSFEHTFYQLIQQGIEEECAAKGLSPDQYTVLDASLDPVIATQKVETLTADGCNAIALACNDAAGVKPAIENADADGVAMFTFDCTSESDAINCFVGTDNVEGGRLGGQELLRLTNDGDTVAIIGYPTASSCKDREDGCLEVLEGADRNVLTGYDYKGDANEAQKIMENILTTNPEVKAVFTVGDPACTGALAAIKAAGSDCVMIGFDGNPEAKEAILSEENGKYWVSEISQNPKVIGSTIVDEMIKYMTEGTVTDKQIFIAPYIITAENAAE